MEIFEQLKLLFIIVMFFMSYQYVSNSAPALTFQEEEKQEEEIQEEQDDGQNEVEVIVISDSDGTPKNQPQKDPILAQPFVKQEVVKKEGKEINTEEAINLLSSESCMEIEEDQGEP